MAETERDGRTGRRTTSRLTRPIDVCFAQDEQRDLQLVYNQSWRGYHIQTRINLGHEKRVLAARGQ